MTQRPGAVGTRRGGMGPSAGQCWTGFAARAERGVMDVVETECLSDLYVVFCRCMNFGHRGSPTREMLEAALAAGQDELARSLLEKAGSTAALLRLGDLSLDQRIEAAPCIDRAMARWAARNMTATPRTGSKRRFTDRRCGARRA